MTGYQKLKKENEALQEANDRYRAELRMYDKAILEIMDLKGPGITRAPLIAFEAYKERVRYEIKDND